MVLAWFVDTIAQGLLPLDPLLLRLLRLVKLFRMLRLVRTIQGFDSLYAGGPCSHPKLDGDTMIFT